MPRDDDGFNVRVLGAGLIKVLEIAFWDILDHYHP